MRTTTKQWCERNGSRLVRYGWRRWQWTDTARFVLQEYLMAVDPVLSRLPTFTSRKRAEDTLDAALQWWREVGR